MHIAGEMVIVCIALYSTSIRLTYNITYRIWTGQQIRTESGRETTIPMVNNECYQAPRQRSTDSEVESRRENTIPVVENESYLVFKQRETVIPMRKNESYQKLEPRMILLVCLAS